MKFFIGFIIFFCFATTKGQITNNSPWTWMKGDSTAYQLSVYGTQGVSAPANKPSGRGGPCTWRVADTLFMFAGVTRYSSGTLAHSNEVWKYNTVNNQWTWMKGDNAANGYYGTQGVSTALTKPPGKNGAVSWSDAAGDNWSYGGAADFVLFGDLWKYSRQLNSWTWMGGDSLKTKRGVYGVQGVGTTATKPGARTGAVSWSDTSGNLWLFGGYTMVGASLLYQPLNDLWKYNKTTKIWTWVHGDSLTNKPGVYGVKGVPSALNKPGSRGSAMAWTDTSGNFWLYGGNGLAKGTTSNWLNDLWKYNITLNQWTWVSGSDTLNQPPVYGTIGVYGSTNQPGGRTESETWTDAAGNFMLYGGGSYRSTQNGYAGYLADVWQYKISTNEWVWVKGDTTISPSAVYGVQGLPNNNNKPPVKINPGSWTDKSGNFWLAGDEFRNDLWRLSTQFIFIGDGNWNTASNWLGNVAAPTNVPAGTEVIIDPSGQCLQTGNLTTQQLGKVQVKPGKTLSLNGDLNNAGSLDGTGVLNFASGASQLTSTGTITTTLLLTAKKMSLNSDLVAGSIVLTNKSKMQLGNFNLKIDTFALVANDSNFIVTNGTGKLYRTVGTTPVVFPVGVDSNSYSPVIISSTAAPGGFKVSVNSTVTASSKVAAPVTTGHVNRTWVIVDSSNGGRTASMKFQWNQADEQPGFNRSNAYVAQSHACQPPPNCTDIYYDIQARSSATGTSPGPFTLTRDNITSPTTFIIKSSTDTLKFTGNGNWTDPNNWTPGIVPSTTISNGKEVIINHITGGQCIVDGDIIVQPGGKLNVPANKRLKVNGKIIVQ